MIVNCNLLWSDLIERMQSFDLLRQILVTHVFDLTQIRAEGSGCRWGAVGTPDHDSCVTKICRNRSKRCIVSSKSLQSKF